MPVSRLRISLVSALARRPRPRPRIPFIVLRMGALPCAAVRSTLSALCQLFQALLLVERDALLHDHVDVARHDRVERKVGRETVVGAARVLVVVRPNLLRARSRAHLHLACGGDLGGLLLLLHGEELRAQHLHRELLVLQLRALLRHEEADARRLVRQVDRRLHLVHVLPAGAARARRVHLDVARVNLDGHLVHLGHDRHGGRRGVDPPLRLRRRHALHAVHAGLELELRVDGVALDLDGGVAAAPRLGVRHRHHARLPPLRLRVLRVQLQQVGRPDGRLVAAGAGADLEHHVLLVVRVGRKQQQLQLLVELFQLLLYIPRLLARHLTHLRVAAARLEQLARLGELLLEAGVEREGLNGLLEPRVLL
mmetsp:Transcript_29273/g.50075  ORF Transcript_29273/g.50075 Transcript_29273/m.50075 type:complete len:367 (+) Transcript_29273:74-1174(+)